jgi:hypothetical protein
VWWFKKYTSRQDHKTSIHPSQEQVQHSKSASPTIELHELYSIPYLDAGVLCTVFSTCSVDELSCHNAATLESRDESTKLCDRTFDCTKCDTIATDLRRDQSNQLND